MNCIKGFFVLLVVAAVAGLVTLYSGIIDVGATNPHNAFTQWLLSAAMDSSVRAHAKGVEAPPLEDPQLVVNGFRHYREMCVDCHLAPGITSSEIRKGLMPEAPALQEVVEEWTPAELFWVVKHGVKMTGMPAWGPTHSDEEIWAIVAFLEKLPHMSAQQYEDMDRTAGPGEGDEDSEHPHAEGGHDPDHEPAHQH
jgi:mono/diheme cytochrome c family protein